MNKVSKTEDKLYSELTKKGLKPKRQYKISDMHVDFAFPEFDLIAEVDGNMHKTEEDEKRDYVTGNLGWKTLRFNADFTFKNTKYVANKIEEELIKRGLKNGKQKTLIQETKEEKTIKKEAPINNTNSERMVSKEGAYTPIFSSNFTQDFTPSFNPLIKQQKNEIKREILARNKQERERQKIETKRWISEREKQEMKRQEQERLRKEEKRKIEKKAILKKNICNCSLYYYPYNCNLAYLFSMESLLKI